MKIWLLMHGEPLPVNTAANPHRTSQLSRKLASRGHDVTYWCSSFDHHQKELYCCDHREVQVDDYTLKILHAGQYQKNHSLSRYFHHKRMAKMFAKEAHNKELPDIIIAGLPHHYCVYEAVRFGKKHRVPVIIDIRDYWPDVYLMMFPRWLRWVGRLIFWNDFKITKVAMRNATALVSMMSQLLDWGMNKYADRMPTSDDRVFFIGGDPLNSDDDKDFSRLFPELDGVTDGRFVVNYIGGFSFLTHPMVIIEAARHLNESGHGDDLLFLLAGKGEYHDRCVKAAEGLDNVIFLGWLNAEGIAALNSVTSVGVIPSYEEYSFPNKAFSYLGGGLPILSSEHGDLNKLLQEYEAGFHYDIKEPVQLANKILELSRLDAEVFNNISSNARKLFKAHLQADQIYAEYADHVEHIARKYERSEG